jgi:hypothetical protein
MALHPRSIRAPLASDSACMLATVDKHQHTLQSVPIATEYLADFADVSRSSGVPYIKDGDSAPGICAASIWYLQTALVGSCYMQLCISRATCHQEPAATRRPSRGSLDRRRQWNCCVRATTVFICILW